MSSLLFAGTILGMLVFGEITCQHFFLNRIELSKVISLTRSDGNLVWYVPFSCPYLQVVTSLNRLQSDDRHWYSRSVFPAVCGLVRCAWKLRRVVGYVERHAVSPVLIMRGASHNIHVGYSAS